ncbi:serine/threonine protein kinase [Rufibacter radiotolerans]|uniref:Serine/threonine protein kinase n=1 Tax=Rufibacter radiotolerans TaxID=1379910 RepID=A0A0H4WAU3_9BACT|nr:GAF domain-containing protein [Rufibacter radiotolerans]AKQ47596.1 serine/threonine protein kinase [Rufibacter radiotolerans]
MENTFGIPILPNNEEESLAKLRSLYLLNAYQEEGEFNHIAAKASNMFNVPIALVNLVDSAYVLTKASAGLEAVASVLSGTSLCSLAILKDGTTVFENAVEEPCLLANPMVTGEFGLRFYEAAPLNTSDGYNIGALCILDKEPRVFSQTDQRILQNLASVVMENIEKGVA